MSYIIGQQVRVPGVKGWEGEHTITQMITRYQLDNKADGWYWDSELEPVPEFKVGDRVVVKPRSGGLGPSGTVVSEREYEGAVTIRSANGLEHRVKVSDLTPAPESFAVGDRVEILAAGNHCGQTHRVSGIRQEKGQPYHICTNGHGYFASDLTKLPSEFKVGDRVRVAGLHMGFTPLDDGAIQEYSPEKDKDLPYLVLTDHCGLIWRGVSHLTKLPPEPEEWRIEEINHVGFAGAALVSPEGSRWSCTYDPFTGISVQDIPGPSETLNVPIHLRLEWKYIAAQVALRELESRQQSTRRAEIEAELKTLRGRYATAANECLDLDKCIREIEGELSHDS